MSERLLKLLKQGVELDEQILISELDQIDSEIDELSKRNKLEESEFKELKKKQVMRRCLKISLHITQNAELWDEILKGPHGDTLRQQILDAYEHGEDDV